MNPRATRVLTAILALAAPFAIAQTSGPVAYIYVSSNYSGPTNRVVGFAASADGKLTQISGSPWADNVNYLATNGSLLFGATNIPSDNGKNIFSYRVESNGALKYLGANNIQHTASENNCNVANNLTLDHTGSYLYTYVYMANCNTQWAYQSFAVNKSTGLLKYLGVTQPSAFTLSAPPTMLADNDYAYTAGGEDSQFCGFTKAPNGNLAADSSFGGGSGCTGTLVGSGGQPSGSNGYYNLVSADPASHVAMGVYYEDATTGDYIDTKIATVAINTANGAPSSSSNYSNMPSTDTPVSTMAMAPSGKLLAVGGSQGVQIFNFNPAGQATRNTDLITSTDVTAIYWDTSNHLYVISNTDNSLRVFTVTASGATQASGSPYSIPHPVGITGHSL